MKRTWALTLAVASVVAVASPAMAATAYPIGGVYIRSGPGTQYSVVGSMGDGQSAAILAHEGNWLKVKTSGGTVGYMADWVTREVFDSETVYLQVNTDVLNMRGTPSLDGAVVGQVVQGDSLRVLEGLAGWYRVDAGAKGIGWVKGEYTYRVTSPPATSPPPSTTPPPDRTPPTPPAQALNKNVFATTSTSLRIGRDPDYDPVTPVQLWEGLTYLDSAEGWVKVQKASGDKGWVDGRQLNLTDRQMPFELQAAYNVQPHDWAISYLSVRQVNAYGSGLVLRQGPSAGAAVVTTLQPYQRMKVLAIPGGEYVKVWVEGGATGWISRNFLMGVPGLPTESMRLVQTSPGVLLLDVVGQMAPAQLNATSSAITLSLSQNAGRKSALQVADHGIASIALDANNLTLRFEQPYSYRVLEQTAGHTAIEIRPTVNGVDRFASAAGETVRFRVAGDLHPSAHREGGSIVVSLPGATLGAGAVLPAGVTATPTGTGLTARVASNRSYALKRIDGGFDLVLFAPGLAGKTIVVDPGHGGIESGAVGPTALQEKDVNLGIGMKLKAMLEAAGARVVMTRVADTRCATPEQMARVPVDERLRYDLGCRSEVANTSGADVFMSIHSNANASTAERGTESYWAPDNFNAAQSLVLATATQQELIRYVGLRNRGAKEDMFYVIKFTDAPAVLAEVGFMSNPTEENLLRQDSVRQKAAEGLYTALNRFFMAQ